MISGKERLYWFCQLVAHGHSSSEAKEILDEAIKKLEKVVCPNCNIEMDEKEMADNTKMKVCGICSYGWDID